MPEIRCEARLHGEVSDNSIGILIVRCSSKYCRPMWSTLKDMLVTEHYFNLEKTNEDGIVYPIDTKWYKKPN